MELVAAEDAAGLCRRHQNNVERTEIVLMEVTTAPTAMKYTRNKKPLCT